MSPQELFQTYREDGIADVLLPRHRVHSEGRLHRSVHIFLFNSKWELLVTQRSDQKDICPGHWDLSAAEHQRPKEAGFESAMRGLQEELQISEVTLRPILSWSRHRMTYPELGIIDYEETMTFLTVYDGSFHFADGEVADSRWIPKVGLSAFVSEHKTTPWMQRDLRALGWLDS